MTSRYEPCGLTRLSALRYGTLPIVRATGGLRDTVRDGETGFTFDEPAPDALSDAVERLLQAYTDQPRWQAMCAAARAEDFSWTRSALRYAELYAEVHRAQ